MTAYDYTEADVQAAAEALHETVGSGGLWARLPVGARLRYVGMAEAALSAVVPGIVQRAKAEALREAGEGLATYFGTTTEYALVAMHLTHLADRIEAGEQP